MAIGKLKSQLGFWVLELPSTNGLLIAGNGIVDVTGLGSVVSSVLNWSDFIRSFIGVWFKWNCCHMNLQSLDGFLSMEFAVMEPGLHGVLL
ncbi:hypothetical protein U1Q18_035798 [Sarracenia purpurea var. burkii]